MASSTVENYLKAILRLQAPAGTTTVGDIARELSVTPGTVTTMMRHLSKEGLVDYTPRRGLKLLKKGKLAALLVVRRHRLIESFLVQVMKLDWSEVHEEAEILEHVISERLLDRIDIMLGQPTHDPHGDPIPDKDGKIAEFAGISLAVAEEGIYRVVRVSDEDSALLGWLDENGLTIGEQIHLAHSNRAAGVLEIAKEGAESVQLGIQMAEHVYVEGDPVS